MTQRGEHAQTGSPSAPCSFDQTGILRNAIAKRFQLLIDDTS
ncbi:MAG: hypothetical protein QOJ04_2867, partial [Caballeronia sp.]|nr:hypothetical protein [Caballeronia sp.]